MRIAVAEFPVDFENYLGDLEFSSLKSFEALRDYKDDKAEVVYPPS